MILSSKLVFLGVVALFSSNCGVPQINAEEVNTNPLAMNTDLDPPKRDLPKPPHTGVSFFDQRVLSKIHEINLTEIRLGRLAQQRGTTSVVRAYGDRLERDHRFADGKIKLLAQEWNVDPDAQVPFLSEDEDRKKIQAQRMENIQKIYGTSFDQAFLDLMIRGESETLDMLATAHEQFDTNYELKNLIGEMIPIFRQHETLAEHLVAK